MKKVWVQLIFTGCIFNTYGQPLVSFPPDGMVQGETWHGDWTAPGQFDATITRITDTVIAGELT